LLISPKTNEQLTLIVGQCYKLNRIMDRIVSIMDVTFSCVNSSPILHLQWSHKWPLLADFFYDIQSSFNVLTDYPSTPSDSSTYSTLLDIFQKVLDEVLELNDLITGCVVICQEELDINVKASLENFLATRYIKYIQQAIILRDKAKLYGDDVLGFDRDIKKFFILDDN